MRVHYIDEGPCDGTRVLMLHREPTSTSKLNSLLSMVMPEIEVKDRGIFNPQSV